MTLVVPDFALVVLAGDDATATAFANRHFTADEHAGTVGCLARAGQRLADRSLTVVTSPRLGSHERGALHALARTHHAPSVAVTFGPAGRPSDPEGHGFGRLFGFDDAITAAALRTVSRVPLPIDARQDYGPFDIIGDVHGCADELETLLGRLGYRVRWHRRGSSNGGSSDGGRSCEVVAPPGRRALFLGDLVDRGPRSPDVLRIVMAMIEAGTARAVRGNHDNKFLRWLQGRKVSLNHGLDLTVAQMAAEPPVFHGRAADLINGLVSHLWLADGTLTAVHAGIHADMIGRWSGAVRSFCLYGETNGEFDAYGLPIRNGWVTSYRGPSAVCYGHTPSRTATWVNGTICLDTGCVFGGALTALRWPEGDIVQVPARRQYATPRRPLADPPLADVERA